MSHLEHRILWYLIAHGATSLIDLRVRLGVPLGTLVSALNELYLDGELDSVLLPGGVAYQRTDKSLLS